MIAADDRVNGEFYTAPVYNYHIDQQSLESSVQILDVDHMQGIGTPEDLTEYLLSLTDED